MRITGASIPPAGPPASDPGRAAKRRADPASPAATRRAADPETTAALARAEKAADRSRTTRRDALSRELGRLLELARKLNGVGDLRSNADALQDLARQIAKIARALADAERGLAPADRRGAPPTTLPRAQPSAAAGAAEADTVDDDTARANTAAADPGAGDAPGSPAAGGDDRAAPGEPVPVDGVPVDEVTKRAAERREDAKAGRETTRQLLLQAADMLDRMRKTVARAERFERLLDPEAADARAKAGREIDGYAVELRGLAGGFADPARGPGLDVTA